MTLTKGLHLNLRVSSSNSRNVHRRAQQPAISRIVLAASDSELKSGIANFYDQSSPLWEEVWGEHMHMGHYGQKGDEKKSDVQAQIDMVDRLLEWGQVSAPTHVLDVGCGVGGSSRHIARRYGCKVTGITLSPLQCEHAKERSRQAGLAEKTNFMVKQHDCRTVIAS
eukprot:746187-Hanusia_phi.AAC.1